jgi:simple sugar transport system ATP-binding protein
MMDAIAVQMTNISKYFGTQAANDCIDFTLRRATVHGLLGENGAGKTTLMNVLFGLQVGDKGNLTVKGENLALDPTPLESMRLGIGMVHQHFKLVRTMTVTENFLLGLRIKRYPLLNPNVVRNRILQLSDRFSLHVDPDAYIHTLSVGEQQRVEILSALYRDADILILDEPTAVLTPLETEQLFCILKKLRSEGTSIVLISHHLEEILQIADEVTILKAGKVSGRRTIDASVQAKDLSRLMVGRDVLFDFSKEQKPAGDEVLVVDHLCVRNDRALEAVKEISFSVKAGEILAVAGVDGNGQRELCETLVGLRKSSAGSVLMHKEPITEATPLERIRKKISYIPEDRQQTGLVMPWSIQENLILKQFREKPISNRVFLQKHAIQTEAMRLQQAFSIKCQGVGEPVKALSGGNQQKVILARELDLQPKLLIACHPTRGLDVGAMEYVRKQMLELRNAGCSILMVSADLEEIFQIADRIMVMYEGRSMGIVNPSQGVELVGHMMAGIKDAEELV